MVKLSARYAKNVLLACCRFERYIRRSLDQVYNMIGHSLPCTSILHCWNVSCETQTCPKAHMLEWGARRDDATCDVYRIARIYTNVRARLITLTVIVTLHVLCRFCVDAQLGSLSFCFIVKNTSMMCVEWYSPVCTAVGESKQNPLETWIVVIASCDGSSMSYYHEHDDQT